MKKVFLVLILAIISYALPQLSGDHEIVYRLYRIGKTGPVWMESHKDVDLTKGEPVMGSIVPMPPLSSEYEYELEILIDGEIWADRTPYTIEDRETLRREVPEETGDISETEAVGLVIQGPAETNNTLLRNSLGIGFGSGDPTSQLDVRSGHVRIWDGGATPGYANLAGDLFIANELEVDGTIYSTNWRDGAGNNLLAGGTDISVSEDANGQWTINYTGSSDDGDWTISGSNMYSAIADNVGIGISSPSSKLHVNEQAFGTTFDATTAAIYARNTNPTSDTGHLKGIMGYGYGSSAVNTQYVYGVFGEAYNRPANGRTAYAYGLYGHADGASATDNPGNTMNNYGVYANANGASVATGQVINYGLYATASGGNSNYAGYFNGDVRVTGRVLDSSGDAGTSGQLLSSTGTGTNWIAAPSTDDGDWTTSGSNIYRSSGNVGIGTTTPASNLDVNGTIRSDHYRANDGTNLINAGTAISVAEETDGSWTISVIAGEPENILVYEEECGTHSWSPQPYQQAMTSLGWLYTVATDETNFNSLLTGGTSWDLVVYGRYGNATSAGTYTNMESYLSGGGRLIFYTWTTSGMPASFATALGVTFGSPYSTPLTIYNWTPSHSVMTTPNSIASNIAFSNNTCGTDGFYLTAASGATAVAGYTASPTGGQAACVINSSSTAITMGEVPYCSTPSLLQDFLENQLIYIGSTGGIGGDNLGNHIAEENLQMSGYWISNDGDSEGLFVDTDGDIGIATSSPAYDLHVNGTARITGTLYDSGGDAGTSGQLLSSTGTGTNWIAAPSSGITGSGTTNYVSKWTGTTAQGNSQIYDNGTNVGIGTTSVSSGKLSIIHSDYTTGIWISNPGHGIEVSGMGVGYDGIRSTGNRIGIYATGNTYAGYFSGDVRVTGRVLDSSGDAGTSGQVLSSTGTGTDWTTAGSSSYWTDHGTYLSPAGGEDVYSDGEFYTPSGYGIFHHGATGLGSTTGSWSPDFSGGSGVWIENTYGEGGGFYADANVAAIWSAGDGALLDVYDEDVLTGGPRFRIDGSGNILPGTSDNLRDIGSTTNSWDDLYLGSSSEININGDNGDAGQVLMSDGTNVYWGDAGGSGGSFCSGSVDFGTYASTSNYYPWYSYYNYSRSTSLLLRSELPSCDGGTISALSVYVNSTGSHYFTSMYIYMLETAATSLSGTWYGGTQVYYGSRTFNTTGWVTFSLSPTFVWDSDNLIISFQHGYTSYTTGWPTFRTASSGFTSQNYGYSDGGLPTPSTTTTYRALIRLTFTGSLMDDYHVYMYGDSSWVEPIYDSGTDQLDAGEKFVNFREVFSERLGDDTETSVTVTPKEPCNMLYVPEITNEGFRVVEHEGSSDAEFYWVAIAQKLGRADTHALDPDNPPPIKIDPELTRLKDAFTENPTQFSFSEWTSMFNDIGIDFVTEIEYNKSVESWESWHSSEHSE